MEPVKVMIKETPKWIDIFVIKPKHTVQWGDVLEIRGMISFSKN